MCILCIILEEIKPNQTKIGRDKTLSNGTSKLWLCTAMYGPVGYLCQSKVKC